MAPPFGTERGLAIAMGWIDATPTGPQHVIPGAERVTQAELAQKRALEPLKANRPQALCDVGLFGDGHKQMDLF